MWLQLHIYHADMMIYPHMKPVVGKFKKLKEPWKKWEDNMLTFLFFYSPNFTSKCLTSALNTAVHPDALKHSWKQSIYPGPLNPFIFTCLCGITHTPRIWRLIACLHSVCMFHFLLPVTVRLTEPRGGFCSTVLNSVFVWLLGVSHSPSRPLQFPSQAF